MTQFLEFFEFRYIIKYFVVNLQNKVMKSPLFPPEINRNTLKQKIIQLCKTSSQSLQKQGDYKQTKTFFVSEANHFIENLIHLHSKEVNLFIKNHLKRSMELIHCGTFQQVTNQDILMELSDYSKQKNLQKEVVFNKLQRLFNYYLFKQCSHKSKMQIQNVELQIQCSLNYTCPICIKQGEHNGPYSLKNIDNEVNETDKKHCIQSKTMQQISLNETKENNSFSSNKIIVDKQLLFKLRQNEKIVDNSRKPWNTFGNLLGLQKNRFLRQSYAESNKSKSQRLFIELQLRNMHNDKMIKDFCRKVPNLQKKHFSRSLYVQHSQQINENQNSVALNYFSRKKANSVGESNHIAQIPSNLKQGISDRKKNILKPLANLHHTIQFDRSFNLQNANRTQRNKQPIFTSRKVHFELNSPSLSIKKGRLLVPQDQPVSLKNQKLDIRAIKKQLLPHIFGM